MRQIGYFGLFLAPNYPIWETNRADYAARANYAGKANPYKSP